MSIMAVLLNFHPLCIMNGVTDVFNEFVCLLCSKISRQTGRLNKLNIVRIKPRAPVNKAECYIGASQWVMSRSVIYNPRDLHIFTDILLHRQHSSLLSVGQQLDGPLTQFSVIK